MRYCLTLQSTGDSPLRNMAHPPVIIILVIVATAAALFQDVTAHNPILEALTMGQSSENVSRTECIWRRGNDRDPCPDPDIFFYLYTARGRNGKGAVQPVDLFSPGWLHSSNYEPSHDSVVLIHGYAGIADHLPMGVLRDAYLTNGSYNVFVVDWGRLAQIPCYAASVHNMKPVGKCVAQLMSFLRDAGVPVSRTTCVGHSLGAHVCGVTANYLLFRMHRIIGLDPARPLIRQQPKNRLDAEDAEVVQVMHTSSTFGDVRRTGHIDFCINGGRIQPFCFNTTNEALCSHIRSVCYMAESLNPQSVRTAVPCARRCTGPERTRRPISWERHAPSVYLGQNTPDSAYGTYCVSNNEAPYCPTSGNGIGSPLCCVPPGISNAIQDSSDVRKTTEEEDEPSKESPSERPMISPTTVTARITTTTVYTNRTTVSTS